MAGIAIQVSYDLRQATGALDRVERELRSLRVGGRGQMTAWMQQNAARYIGFLRQRYIKNSRGGGEWPRLAASTLAQRRPGSSRKVVIRRGGRRVAKRNPAGRAAILINTGALLAGLQYPESAQAIRGGVRVGYLRAKRHPSGVSLAKLAEYHQRGGPNLPRRTIIVPPPPALLERMRRQGEGIVAALLAGTKGGRR